jgi:stage II sporulation protein E
MTLGPPGGRARMGATAGLELLRSAFSVEALPLNLLALLVGRATVLQAISPFGLALFAAVLHQAPRRGTGVALAAAAGILSTGAVEGCLAFVIAAAGLGLLLLAFDRPSRVRGPLTLAALAFTVTVGVGLGRALLLAPTPYRLLMAFFGGLLTFVLTLVYLTALPAFLSARRPASLGPEQAIAVAIAVATAMAGLSGIGYAGLRATGVMSGILLLVAAAVAGGGVGAAVGTVSGVVIALCGSGGLSSVGIGALAGLLGGSFREFGRLGIAAGAVCGTLLLSPLIEEAHFLQGVVLEASLAGGIFLLVPERFLARLREAFRAADSGSPDAAAAFAREHVGKRLVDLSLVFGQLAATLNELSAASTQSGPSRGTAGLPVSSSPVRPDAAGDEAVRAPGGSPFRVTPLPAVIRAGVALPLAGSSSSTTHMAAELAQAACRVCQTCRLFRTCWKGDLERARAMLAGLLQVTGERGQLETQDIPTQLRRRCIHLGEMVTTLNFLHEIAALNRHWRKKLDDSRGVVCHQLGGLAQVLRQLGDGLTIEAAADTEAVESLVAELDRAGFDAREVSASRIPDGQVEFQIAARTCESGDACRALALPAASLIAGKTLTVLDVQCGLAAGLDECSFRLAVPRQLNYKLGVSQARKSPSSVSGDSYVIRELPGNRLAVVLSDGMGAGPRAAEESRTTIKMLEELLRLGFDTEMAVRTINSMLLLRSSHERFATLDLLTVDLHDGQARFVKVGAPPSLVRRGREVTAIQAPNLPLGVLAEVGAQGHVVSLGPGDLVILTTDGLFGGSGPEDTWITGFLRNLGPGDPQEVADALVEAVVSLSGSRLPAVAGGLAGSASGYRLLRDDVTVIALRLSPPEEV